MVLRRNIFDIIDGEMALFIYRYSSLSGPDT